MRLHGFVDPRHMTLEELRLLRLLLLPQLPHRLSLTTVELGAAKRRAVTLPPSIAIERLIAHDAAWRCLRCLSFQSPDKFHCNYHYTTDRMICQGLFP
jgi:hypothetical protein